MYCHLTYLSVLIQLLHLEQIRGWHMLDNAHHHCWSLDANDNNNTAFDPQGGCRFVEMNWIVPPPETVTRGQLVWTKFELCFQDEFWAWAVNETAEKNKGNLFIHSNNGGPFKTGLAAKEWCHSTACSLSSGADERKCCIHHVDIHACVLRGEVFCAPWAPVNGDLNRQSETTVGQLSQRNWTAFMPRLYKTEPTQIIAHMKVAHMHLALYATVHVHPGSVCGDGRCEEKYEEDCRRCPEDCSCLLDIYEIVFLCLSIPILFGILIATYCIIKRC